MVESSLEQQPFQSRKAFLSTAEGRSMNTKHTVTEEEKQSLDSFHSLPDLIFSPWVPFICTPIALAQNSLCRPSGDLTTSAFQVLGVSLDFKMDLRNPDVSVYFYVSCYGHFFQTKMESTKNFKEGYIIYKLGCKVLYCQNIYNFNLLYISTWNLYIRVCSFQMQHSVESQGVGYAYCQNSLITTCGWRLSETMTISACL